MIRTSAALLALAVTVACAGRSGAADRAAPAPPPPAADRVAVAMSPAAAEKAEAAEVEAVEAALVEAAEPSPGGRLFAQLCSACHTVGQGRSVGPDLAGVTERRDREWLVRWIRDPVEMARSDSTGRALLREWNGFPMPDMGLSDEEARLVVAYLEAPDEAGLARIGRGGHGCMHGQGGGGGMGMRMRMRHGAEGAGGARGGMCGGGPGMHGRAGDGGGQGRGMMCGRPPADITGAEPPSS